MLSFLVRRLVSLFGTVLAAALAVFVVLEVLPGDPALLMLGTEAQPDTLAALRLQMGLDRPAWLRFLVWFGGFLTGDLGISHTYGMPVAALVRDRLAVTVPLALLALVLSVAVALPAGMLAAMRHRRPGDHAVMVFSQLGMAVPGFWFAILLILVFSLTLGWFASGGFPGWSQGALPALKALVLPAVALALPEAAILARVTRGALLDTLNEDYMRTARAKGLSRRARLWRHALPNALVPVTTVIGLQGAFLMAGAVVIENVFYLPGLGRLIYQAVGQRDVIVVKDVVVLLAIMVVAINFLVDVVQAAIDPRPRSPA